MYPIEIIQQAKRTGYYRRMKTGCVFGGQTWKPDQMTGEGQIEGSLTGEISGYFAEIEMKNGYIASLYMPIPEIKGKGNKEDIVLAKLIKDSGIPNYQGEIHNDRQ